MPHSDPKSPEVQRAERLVLAERSARAAEVGTEDCSVGDLISVLIGKTPAETLERLSIELALAGLATDESERPPTDMAAYIAAVGKRAAAAAELHRRLERARREDSALTTEVPPSERKPRGAKAVAATRGESRT